MSLKRVLLFSLCILVLSGLVGCRETEITVKSEFVERFPELSLFFKAYSLLDSEMICIFPYLCPYAESAREIREIFS
ncbi:hypothetical protein DWY50_19125 [Ruminococcus sp. AF25-28AC]|nr:hypothetical protein DWY50_19125 [Ruminococcus sp. AF25-28AC]